MGWQSINDSDQDPEIIEPFRHENRPYLRKWDNLMDGFGWDDCADGSAHRTVRHFELEEYLVDGSTRTKKAFSKIPGFHHTYHGYQRWCENWKTRYATVVQDARWHQRATVGSQISRWLTGALRFRANLDLKVPMSTDGYFFLPHLILVQGISSIRDHGSVLRNVRRSGPFDMGGAWHYHWRHRLSVVLRRNPPGWQDPIQSHPCEYPKGSHVLESKRQHEI